MKEKVVIGISGVAGSGKDTVGEMLKDFLNEEQIHCNIYKFAGSLKEMTCTLIGCTMDQLEDREFKNSPMGGNWGDLTPRIILQKLGTECVRNIIHEDAWVNSTFSKIDNDESKTSIITDLRFPNEFEEIKRRDGITIKVIRPNQESNTPPHSSETALDHIEGYRWEHIIINDGSLEDLREKVREIFK